MPAQPGAGRGAAGGADPPAGERLAGQRRDRGGHPLADTRPGRSRPLRCGGGHPQQPAPAATASAFAVAAAARARRLRLGARCRSTAPAGPRTRCGGEEAVACGGLPQQPPVPVDGQGRGRVAGEAAAVWSRSGRTHRVVRRSTEHDCLDVSTRNQRVARCFDICQPRGMSKQATPLTAASTSTRTRRAARPWPRAASPPRRPRCSRRRSRRSATRSGCSSCR